MSSYTWDADVFTYTHHCEATEVDPFVSPPNVWVEIDVGENFWKAYEYWPHSGGAGDSIAVAYCPHCGAKLPALAWLEENVSRA